MKRIHELEKALDASIEREERLQEALRIAKEIIESIDDLECNFPEWWHEASFTTEEYGEEMLSQAIWFERRKKQLEQALKEK